MELPCQVVFSVVFVSVPMRVLFAAFFCGLAMGFVSVPMRVLFLWFSDGYPGGGPMRKFSEPFSRLVFLPLPVLSFGI